MYACFTGPSALQVITTKSTMRLSVVVQWDEVYSTVPITYLVTWTSERGHNGSSPGLTYLTSYTITGLMLDRVYTIIVAANNKCGTGPENKSSVSFPTGTIFTMYVHTYILL